MLWPGVQTTAQSPVSPGEAPWRPSEGRAYLSDNMTRITANRKMTSTAGQYGALLAASMDTHPTQEGRAVTEQPSIQDPEPFRVPSTGFLLEYDSQVYEVQKTGTHVDLQRDPEGREQHTLEVRIQAVWAEDGYHQPGLDGLL